MTAKFCLTAVEDKPKLNALVYSNFKYEIAQTPKCVKLIESCFGTETVLGHVRNWKKSLFLKIAQSLEEKDEKEKGYRLFLALKLLKEIHDAKKADAFVKAIQSLTLEETIFWVWQYHSYGKVAINAFKCVHVNSASIRRGLQ